MTFTEIVTEIMDRANLSSSTATTRVGRRVNSHYKRVTAELGIAPVTRRTSVTQAATVASPSITFSNIEQVERVIDATTTPDTILEEVSFDEIRQVEPASSDTVTKFAREALGSTSVTLRFDVKFATTKNITAEGYGKKATLSGTDVPAFPETFHDILVESVLYEEYKKLEDMKSATDSKEEAKRILSQLKLWVATSAYRANRQGRDQ